ncbi:MAG: 50S ribosomal protein L17 [Herpetosiphonaceae bacterium]|nr:MAG: 50S ribosomal protein L17 [Herpetosiphonaceae bacterium]
MRHRVAGKKLGRPADQRKAMYRSMLISIIQHGKIRTTEAKAKALQPQVESLIALAREDTPHARRMALSKLANKQAMRKLFTVGVNYAERPGGYTRLTRLGPRKGDAAEMALLELV